MVLYGLHQPLDLWGALGCRLWDVISREAHSPHFEVYRELLHTISLGL
jgi:hypothetical protein